MRVKILALSTSITLGLALPVSAGAQIEQKSDSIRQDTSNQDAEFFFQYLALPHDYIQQPSQLQIPENEVIARLREEFLKRFAGAYVTQLYPQHRIVVHLKGNEPIASRKLQFGDDVLIIDFVHGHEHSEADMENAIAVHWGVLARIFPDLQGAGISGNTGEVILYMDMPHGNAEAMNEMRSLAREILKMPVRIFVLGPARFLGSQ